VAAVPDAERAAAPTIPPARRTVVHRACRIRRGRDRRPHARRDLDRCPLADHAHPQSVVRLSNQAAPDVTTRADGASPARARPGAGGHGARDRTPQRQQSHQQAPPSRSVAVVEEHLTTNIRLYWKPPLWSSPFEPRVTCRSGTVGPSLSVARTRCAALDAGLGVRPAVTSRHRTADSGPGGAGAGVSLSFRAGASRGSVPDVLDPVACEVGREHRHDAVQLGHQAGAGR
jgi:hypothetical protein